MVPNARPDPPQLTSALTPGSVAAALVLLAEEAEPALVRESLWRAGALQRPQTADPQQMWRYHTGNNALAIVIGPELKDHVKVLSTGRLLGGRTRVTLEAAAKAMEQAGYDPAAAVRCWRGRSLRCWSSDKRSHNSGTACTTWR